MYDVAKVVVTHQSYEKLFDIGLRNMNIITTILKIITADTVRVSVKWVRKTIASQVN